MPIKYSTRFQGTVQTGLTGGELRSQAASNTLTPQHEVRIEGTDLWFSSSELVGLWFTVRPGAANGSQERFEPRRWSLLLLVLLFFTTQSSAAAMWAPGSWSPFRWGVAVCIAAYLLGEFVEHHRPLLTGKTSRR